MRFRIREIFFLIAMLALFGCSYVLVFREATNKRSRLQADIVAKKKALTEFRQSTEGVDRLQQEISELQKSISTFQSRLPKEGEIDEIVKNLTRFASVNSLTPQGVKLLHTESAAGYGEQPVQMTFSGDFNGVYAFLLQVEQLPRLTRVSQMKISRTEEHDTAVRVQITLSIFYEPTTPSTVAFGEKD